MIHYYTGRYGQVMQSDVHVDDCWINLSAPFEPKELETISRDYSIPPDFLTDSLDRDERSRYEREDDIRLIVVNTPILNEDPNNENEAIYVTVPIGIIITPDDLLTIYPTENPVLTKFIEGRVKGIDLADIRKFVLKIFEQNVFAYLDCLKRLNLKRGLIERELYNSSRTAELKQLLRIEKSLVYIVNSLSSNELLKMKVKRTDFLRIEDDEDLVDLFEDIIIDNSQALEMANVHTNILSGTMEAYASIVSNNLNIFIQRLTIVTIILMVPTLVASFYGMNVPLPFGQGDSPWAFPFIVLVAIIISILLVWFFRRKELF